MRNTIVRVLKVLLDYFAEKDPRLARVKEIVAWAGEFPVNGERKRSQALNKLVVEFPEANKRDLAFMIEQVLQETK